MENQTIINVKSIEKGFGDRKVLSDLSLHVKKGETVSVLGISGSGKTTLFHIIAGMIDSDQGIIEKQVKMGYMMQKDLLMPWKTVIENISLPLILEGKKKEEAFKTANEYLPKFGLEGTARLYPDSLSGGMRQRASLLRTYLQSGELLLLDEPFSSVDAITRHQLHKWIKEIKEKFKLSILLITHDVEEALSLSDRIYILSGTPASISHEIDLASHRTEKTSELYKSFTDKTRDRIYKILESEISQSNN